LLISNFCKHRLKKFHGIELKSFQVFARRVSWTWNSSPVFRVLIIFFQRLFTGRHFDSELVRTFGALPIVSRFVDVDLRVEDDQLQTQTEIHWSLVTVGCWRNGARGFYSNFKKGKEFKFAPRHFYFVIFFRAIVATIFFGKFYSGVKKFVRSVNLKKYFSLVKRSNYTPA